MKRFFPIIISVMMITVMLFTGCTQTGETTVSPKEAININYDLLTESLADEGESEKNITFDQFADIVSTWAKDNNINVVSINDKYLILSKEASGELKNVESFAFHSAVDFNDDALEGSLESAATVMTILSSAQNHGQLTGIFTLEKNNVPVGAQALNPEYLDSDNLIDVAYDEDTLLYNTIAATSNMSAEKKLEITAPQYTKAYKIEFEGKKNQSAFKNRGVYPNPVKTIGDLLASCQTSTILFELASFNGGSSSDMIPGKVSATIVLHENDVEAFTKKFDNSYKKIEEAYEDIDDENATFQYTFTPVDLPAKVISKEDTENIVSLMYTMINGTYLRNDNDEVEAYSSIGTVSTDNGMFKLGINAKSLDDTVMEEIQSVVKTICGLSDINYKLINSAKVYTNDPTSPLVSNMSSKLGAECSGILEAKATSAIIEKNKDVNLIIWKTNISDAEKDIDKIIEYMAIAGAEELTEDAD